MRWNHTPTAGPHKPVGAADHVVDLNKMIPRPRIDHMGQQDAQQRGREKGSHVIDLPCGVGG